VVTPDPIGAMGAACEAGTATKANAAIANARTDVFMVFLLGWEAIFKPCATRQQQCGCTLEIYHEWNCKSDNKSAI
jgi:hypothetical protein